MIQALLSQQVHISFFSLPLMVPHIKAGKMKGLAVGSRARVPQLPDVQTLSETFPGFEQYSWFGILGPAGLPKDVAAKVHRETVRTLQAPDVNGKLTEQGFEIVASSPEEFVKFVQGESDKLGKLIRENKIVAE
jgi:tripartite-type tricarboxylate transporter receptor subunit TctC